MNLIALAALSDNYIWMLHDGRSAIVVDPGDARPVVCALEQSSLSLVGILVTHHHLDHTAGIATLKNYLAPGFESQIYGPNTSQIPGIVAHLHDQDEIKLLGLNWRILDVPGHTLDHIAYYAPCQPGNPEGMLFCGDTLFNAGCGRLFEGSAAQLYDSLQKLKRLPSLTLMCCTHEYTLSNLKFAMHIEPHNQELRAYFEQCQSQRSLGSPTLPTTMQLQSRVNPFLRCDDPALVAEISRRSTCALDPLSVFAAMRELKNTFN